MNQREKEAVATLAYAGLLLGLVILCWLQQSVAAFPWVAGPISLGYGLYIALTHDAAKRRRCAVYDERDVAIEGKAWRAALNGAIVAFAVYTFGVVMVYGRSTDAVRELSLPLMTLPFGVIVLTWSAGVSWALATLYHSRFTGMADANRQPSS
jgi:hypothetical protein